MNILNWASDVFGNPLNERSSLYEGVTQKGQVNISEPKK